ncbi:gamma-glutamyltransferase [Paraburkholderia hospita]|uniref:gamma-glutamyltransferase n=1 Tax=Paraburkholderia hospita TaxID=169430 RepID=UPI001F42BBDB|nr:gamma-glutamyltransferase [Paraburkholderia hospita]
MAATSHSASTLAAVKTPEAGGNARDAAIAGCAVPCVVEAGSTGIGGDCFTLYSRGGGDGIIASNGSGRAPQASSVPVLRLLSIERARLRTGHAVGQRIVTRAAKLHTRTRCGFVCLSWAITRGHVDMAALRNAEDGCTHHHLYCGFVRSCPIAATTACSQSLRPATD